MAQFTFDKMSQSSAEAIADTWKYDGEYAFYDMTADPEDYAELICEETRNRSDYFEARLNGALAGYFCAEASGEGLEIGLGLRPDLCGKGMGKAFFSQILDFVAGRYACQTLILRVAAFNRRAMRVYRACGFADDGSYLQKTNGGEYAFVKMVKR